MTSSDFSTQTHAKWILAGEHAVLRESPAIVFPLKNRSLKLNYSDNQNDCRAEFIGSHGDDVQLLFWGVLEHGMEMLQHSFSDLKGQFVIESNIPVGVGMGISAALCSALARWFLWRGLVQEVEVYEFARQLENLFHSESSGVDIAGAISDTGVVFQREGMRKTLIQNWQPRWYLSYCDQVGLTSQCVKKVKELWQRNPELAKQIDQDMQNSVLLAEKALSQPEQEGMQQLAEAINNAKICFSRWGLASGKVEQHINQLLQAGAVAAKPTGSGEGGYVLSLWPQGATPDMPFEMIRA